MGTVAIKEVECLVFCIFWCQLLKILKARQKHNALEEKKVTANPKSFCFYGREENNDGFCVGRTWSRQLGREVLLLASSWAEMGNRVAGLQGIPDWIASAGPTSLGSPKPRSHNAPAFTPFAPIQHYPGNLLLLTRAACGWKVNRSVLWKNYI